MKNTLLVLCLFLLIGCKSSQSTSSTTAPTAVEIKNVKLAFSEVDASQKNKAYELGKRVLMTCNSSKFKPFSESEATPSVIQNTTAERLTKTCTKFRQYYGSFKDLQLMQIYQNTDDKTIVFRFKALYTKAVANKELRVSLNEENKVSAIKSLDWVDSFH